MKLPAMCPDIPVADLAAALAYYRDSLGFAVDWSADGIGLACLSRGDTRLFMSNAQFRAPLGVRGPILLWLNLDGREEIDELHREWHAAGAKLSGPPAAHPDAKLYEFFAEDLDGNYIRVFYDYAWEERENEQRSAGR